MIVSASPESVWDCVSGQLLEAARRQVERRLGSVDPQALYRGRPPMKPLKY
jgi:hypothetical protein